MFYEFYAATCDEIDQEILLNFETENFIKDTIIDLSVQTLYTHDALLHWC